MMLDWVLVLIVFTGNTCGHVAVDQVQMQTEAACKTALKQVPTTMGQTIAFCVKRV